MQTLPQFSRKPVNLRGKPRCVDSAMGKRTNNDRFSTGVDLLDCQALYSTSSPLGNKPKSAEHIKPQTCQNTQAAEVYHATTPQSFNQTSILQLLKVMGGLMFARQSHSFSGLYSHAVYFGHRWRPLSSIHMPTHHKDYRLLGPILGSPYSWKLPALTRLIATTTVLLGNVVSNTCD